MEKIMPEDKEELLRRATKEQKLRQKWEKDLENEEIIEQVRQLDADNTVFLKGLIAKSGWPKISQIGKKAAQAAWLIAQHSPDKDFLRHCLQLMQKDSAEVEPQNLARSVDRVRIYDGKLQYYGTHFRQNPDGTHQPLPIEDEATVNERRVARGLLTIEDQIKKYERES